MEPKYHQKKRSLTQNKIQNITQF